MAIDERFIIERQGKQFVLFAGLLDEFHTRFTGARAITTELLQPPHDMNNNICIVKARVEAQDADGHIVIFEGIGDASAENVGRNIAPHVIRMAETRAKARALRDAINVGATSFEELGGEEQGESRVRNTPKRSSSSSPSASGFPRKPSGPDRKSSEASSDNPMSEAQERYLKKLCDETGHNMPDTSSFTAKDASELIKRLQAGKARSGA